MMGNMEAKDTVMRPKEIEETLRFRLPILRPNEGFALNYDDLSNLLSAQAEISFKAGGLKVVNWIDSLDDAPIYSVCEGTNIRIPEPPGKLILRSELQAKLREWGLLRNM